MTNRTTLEDAIEALGRLPASPEVDTIQDFFQTLKDKIGPVDIPTDDDATLLVVSAQALINYTKRQRGAP